MIKIEKIKPAANELREYRENPDIRRRKILKGSYEKIVFASDQDLD